MGTGPAKRPRLLFLCHALPYPPDEGFHIRAYHLLRLLSGAFDVTALFFYRHAMRPDEASVRRGVGGLEKLAEVHAFPVPQSLSRARFVRDHLRSVLTGSPYTRYVYDSTGFRRALIELLCTRTFDLVHVDSLDLCAYLPFLEDVPVCLGHHNVESSLLRRRADVERSRPVRRYLELQARLVEREERRWCPAVALNVVVSEVDRDQLTAIAPGAKSLVVPNGVDTTVLRPATRSSGILFVGGHGWAPNREAMRHFCENVLPHIRTRHPDVPVTWVGRTPERVQREYADRFGIHVTGYVDDIAPWLAEAACYVAPLLTGGGTRLKILDAWAAGQAVVSTSIGCEGLDARDGENILIRDDPAQFAAAVCQVVEDSSLRRSVGSAARATAEALYDWDVVARTLVPEYLGVAGVSNDGGRLEGAAAP
jgi:glycosyltransferase involved in cell wall biosynthesis